jgi:putative sigma-54 modulation protein
MQIIFEYDEVTSSQRLESFATEKLKQLAKKYDFVHRADVFFKSQNRTDNKEQICDIRLSMPGPRVFASTNSKSFASAITETINQLEQQLKKRKETLEH